MAKSQPLAEVFGFPALDKSRRGLHVVSNGLCPFHNVNPHCTKDKAENPLGVCSIFDKGKPVVICPIRFTEDFSIISDASKFYFGKSKHVTSFREVPLKEANGRSAGNIDYVIVKHDGMGGVVDYISVEVQAVYISGNVRDPFKRLMESPKTFAAHDWSKQLKYPKPDFLSSSRKRLAPQLLFKGSILAAWNRRMAVAIDESFFENLPTMKECAPAKADLLWMVYKLKREATGCLRLTLARLVPTKFHEAMKSITVPEIGPEAPFLQYLGRELKKGTKILRTDEPFSVKLTGTK